MLPIQLLWVIVIIVINFLIPEGVHVAEVYALQKIQ